MSASDGQGEGRTLFDPRAEAVELGAYFCANSSCALHVRAGDPGVTGEGDWIVLPDGRTFGRLRHGDRVLCDACGTGRGPVKIPIDRQLRDEQLAERANRDE
jgi:hypothetical protein